MKGMELARAYYEQYGRDMILSKFPTYAERVACGLAGEGSECFGYDDAISTDHDFGPSFCIWLTAEDYQAVGAIMQAEYNKLPGDFLGYPPRDMTGEAEGRVGVICIDDFFKRQIGRADAEFTLREWLMVPETRFATVTNGEVFSDPLGKFTAIREKLLEYYPEDIRRKKIAARAAIMGQAGQYNYPRSMKRGETVAAMYALNEFITHAISTVYLINRRYMPYYKWMHHGVFELPFLGKKIGELTGMLASNGCNQYAWETFNYDSGDALNSGDNNVLIIEQICRLIAEELQLERLSRTGSSFMVDQGNSVMQSIRDPRIKSMHLMVG